ncbi:MAG TPA: response regulator transcription factor [Rhizomicrobium sp.]|nr:response regulator transcription factor [Rhizomicrobium sp.]HUN44405.1 response regulator transcription factor [Acetobacteraceae bacterium]
MDRQDQSIVRSGASHQRKRILIADDQTILIDMLRNLLHPEFEVVATANDGPGLVEQTVETCPDIVVVDISMPGCSGVEAARRIRAVGLTARLVFLTMQADPEIAAEAFAAGASGYLLKSRPAAEFVKALRHVAEGRRYLTPAIQGGDIEALPTPRQHGLAHISLREREVLKLLVSGLPIKTVATRLGIKPRTVAFHRHKTMEILGLKDNAQLLDFALRYGLLGSHADSVGRL